MIKGERKKCNDWNGTRKRITKILRKSTQSGDFQPKGKSTMCPDPRLTVGHLLCPLMCAASRRSQGQAEAGGVRVSPLPARPWGPPAETPPLRNSLSSRGYTQKL